MPNIETRTPRQLLRKHPKSPCCPFWPRPRKYAYKRHQARIPDPGPRSSLHRWKGEHIHGMVNLWRLLLGGLSRAQTIAPKRRPGWSYHL